MKKKSLILILLIMGLSVMTACSQNRQNKATTKIVSYKTPNTQGIDAEKIGEYLTENNYRFTVEKSNSAESAGNYEQMGIDYHIEVNYDSSKQGGYVIYDILHVVKANKFGSYVEERSDHNRTEELKKIKNGEWIVGDAEAKNIEVITKLSQLKSQMN
jgi:hypothetical protein